MVLRISARQLGVVVDHDVVYKLNNGVERLPNQFWKQAELNLEYFSKRSKHEQMYEKLEAQIDEALRMYNCRDSLTPPLKDATLFEMDRKVHYFDGTDAWLLPQTRGKVLFSFVFNSEVFVTVEKKKLQKNSSTTLRKVLAEEKSQVA